MVHLIVLSLPKTENLQLQLLGGKQAITVSSPLFRPWDLAFLTNQFLSPSYFGEMVRGALLNLSLSILQPLCFFCIPFLVSSHPTPLFRLHSWPACTPSQELPSDFGTGWAQLSPGLSPLECHVLPFLVVLTFPLGIIIPGLGRESGGLWYLPCMWLTSFPFWVSPLPQSGVSPEH